MVAPERCPSSVPLRSSGGRWPEHLGTGRGTHGWGPAPPGAWLRGCPCGTRLRAELNGKGYFQRRDVQARGSLGSCSWKRETETLRILGPSSTISFTSSQTSAQNATGVSPGRHCRLGHTANAAVTCGARRERAHTHTHTHAQPPSLTGRRGRATQWGMPSSPLQLPPPLLPTARTPTQGPRLGRGLRSAFIAAPSRGGPVLPRTRVPQLHTLTTAKMSQNPPPTCLEPAVPRPWEAPDLGSRGPGRAPLAASWLRAGNRAAAGGPTPATAGHSSTPPTAETPLLSVASPWPPRARCPALLQPRAPDPEPRAGKALGLVPTVVGSELFRHTHTTATCARMHVLAHTRTPAHAYTPAGLHALAWLWESSLPLGGGGSCTGGSHILRPPPVAPREPSSRCHLNKGVEKRSSEASVRICRRSSCGHNQYHRLRG